MEIKYDMFNKVSDRRDIVSFVKEIEKYPCLYNKTLPEYANKVHNRRAWSAIAKKINTTVPDCRDKWRKIRISYMRSLKQQHSDKPPMRPYYLSEELQFLRPFLTINPKAPNQKEEHMDFEVSALKKHESSDSEGSDPFDIEIAEDEHENDRVTCKEVNSIAEKPKEIVYIKQNERNNFIEQKHYVSNSYSNEKQFGRNSYGEEKQHIRSYNEDLGSDARHIRSYNEDLGSDARKMFLLSLLPDVNCFTESEMRIFRREVIGACDNIINKRTIRNCY